MIATTVTSTDHPTPRIASMRRLRPALAGLALLGTVALAGCGGSSSGSAKEPASGDKVAGTSAPAGNGTSGTSAGGDDGGCGTVYTTSVCATVKVTGSETVDDNAVSAVDGDDCAAWAKGSDDELRLPLFIDGLSDGTPFTMERLVTDYTGPGTYELDKLSGEGTGFTLVVGSNRYVARPDGDATATLTIDEAGSGSVAISQFEVSDGAGGYGSPVDADIYWTCIEPS